MSVRGSLSTMSVEDLLDWVDRRQVNGTLTAEWSSTVRAFTFEGGYITSASSSQPGEHAGQVLLRGGLVDQDMLGHLLEAQAESGASLSRLAVSMAGVDETALRHVLEEQAQEALLDTWAWPGGTFVFERVDERPTAVDLQIGVRLRMCIVIGRQRVHRWKQIRQLVPADDVYLQVADRDRLAAADDGSLGDMVELVTAMDSRASGISIEELVAYRHGRRFVVLDQLARLIEQGCLVVSDTPARATVSSSPFDAIDIEAGQASAQALEQAARQRAAEGDSDGAFGLAQQALARDPHNPAVQRLYREVERTLFAQLSRDLLSTFRVPRLLVARESLDDLQLGDTERYLAGRIDGHWDLLSLMRVSPLREVEVLITFKRLADRGIISL